MSFMKFIAAAFAAMVLAALPQAAQARWLKAESSRFIVYSDGGESALRQYVLDIEVFDSLLRARHGLPESGAPLRKLPIYLVRDRSGLQRTWHKAGDSVAGYYSPGSADVFAVAVMESYDDQQVVFKHEYVHHFMLGSFPGAYPAWMVEGYAEYYAQTVIKGLYVDVGNVAEWRSYELRNERWIPMADLLANKRPAHEETFYGQSWLLTHYLMSSPDRYKQFQTYASLVGKGGDPVQSMVTATGMSPDQLEAALRRYMNGKLPGVRYKRTDFTVPTVTITELPPSADALLLDRLQIVSHSYKDTNAGYLDMIRGKAARFPNDQLAVLALGQAELELGDPAKGRALLLDWIKANPTDVEAMFVLGHNLIWKSDAETDPDKAKAMRAEARTVLEPAATLAPNDYRILFAYARSRRDEPGFPTVATQTLLITAYKQAPQVVALRFELIQVLMARRNLREAEALLRPLVNAPHGGEVASRARELMARVQAALKDG